MSPDTQQRLLNEAKNFNGEIPEIFDEKYCLVNELADTNHIGKLNSSERILWTIGEDRLNHGKKTEGMLFFYEAFKSAVLRINFELSDGTLAIDTEGNIFHGYHKYPVYIDLNGPIGKE